MAFRLGSFGPGGPCDCCEEGTLISCCLPCAIPKKDLRFTIEFYSRDTSGFPYTSTLIDTKVVTLTYNNLGGTFLDTWTGSVLCPDAVTRTATLHCSQSPTLDPYGTVYFQAPATTSPYTLSSDAPILYTLTPVPGGNENSSSYTCSPFGVRQEFFFDDGTGFQVLPVGTWTIDDPTPDTYTGTCCPSVMTVDGCNGLPVVGATYSVWTDSGKASQVATGATDAGGNFTFDAIFCGNSLYREISHPRFASVTGSLAYSGGAADNLSTPATGYHCLHGCGIPAADMLVASFATAGDQTLIYGAGVWAGSWTTSGHDYAMSIDASTGALTLTRDGVACGATMSLDSCPPSLSITLTIPAGDCLTELGAGTVTE